MTEDVIAGRYRLIDPIGTGGSGTVWRAVDLQQNRWCAAKLLRQRDAGELLRFVREQAVRLHHPHIVSPYAWSADDGSVLLATELVDGGSLQTLIGDWGPLSDGTITVVLEQLLSALVEVHRAQLIHRDVKPGNILLRATGTGELNTALTDFGLTVSAQDARLTATGMVIGTPGYLPPELLAGRVTPDPGHDVYAVGKLAITLAAGESRTAHDPADLFTDPVLSAAVTAMVAADPADRPADAAAALQSLAGAVRHPHPRTRDGDAVTVLHQLPDLPQPGAVHHTTPQAVPTGPPPTRLESLPPTASSQVEAQTFGTDLRDAPTATVPAGGPRRRPLWPVLTGAGVVIAALVTVIVVANSGTGEDPVTDAPPTTQQSSGEESTSESAPPPPATDPTLEAGAACGWQVEGTTRSTADNTVLTCSLVDGAYVWTA